LISGALLLCLPTCLLLQVDEARAAAEADVMSLTPVYPGARAAGMGGAYLALADDWTAALWNPAGLARMKRTELSGSLSRTNYENSAFLSVDGQPEPAVNSDDRSTRLDHLGFAYPVPVFRGGLAWGLGYASLRRFNQPYGIRDGSHRIAVDERGDLGAFLVSGAAQLSRTFYGGLSLMFLRGGDEYLYHEEDADFNVYHRLDDIELDGFGLRLGGLFRPIKPLWLGLAIQPPLTLNVDLTVSGYEDVDGTTYPFGDGSQYEFRLPLELGLGAAWKERFLILAASMIWRDWSEAEYHNMPGGQDQLLNLETRRGYDPVTQINLGGEITVPGTDLRLRAGAWHHALPQNSTRLSYTAETAGGNPYQVDYWSWKHDTARYGYSLGLGYLIDEVVSLDLALTRELYSFSYLEYQEPGFDAYRISEDRDSFGVILTVYYRMY